MTTHIGELIRLVADELHEVGVGEPLTDVAAQHAVELVLKELRNGARERLTRYMLAAKYDEPDGKVHRQGMIAAVLGDPPPEHDWEMPHNVLDPTVNGCPRNCPYRLAYE